VRRIRDGVTVSGALSEQESRVHPNVFIFERKRGAGARP
jgi:hypothetical protein